MKWTPPLALSVSSFPSTVPYSVKGPVSEDCSSSPSRKLSQSSCPIQIRVPSMDLGKRRKRFIVLCGGRRRSARTVCTALGSVAGAISARISWLPLATEISQPTAFLSPQASFAMPFSNPAKARTALRNSGAGTLSGPSSRVMSWTMSSGAATGSSSKAVENATPRASRGKELAYPSGRKRYRRCRIWRQPYPKPPLSPAAQLLFWAGHGYGADNRDPRPCITPPPGSSPRPFRRS